MHPIDKHNVLLLNTADLRIKVGQFRHKLLLYPNLYPLTGEALRNLNQIISDIDFMLTEHARRLAEEENHGKPA